MEQRPQNKYLDCEAVLQLIEEAKDRFFSVKFVKRTTGEVRLMNCRRNVAGCANVPPLETEECLRHKVVTVYDVKASGFRRIPIDSVLEVRV